MNIYFNSLLTNFALVLHAYRFRIVKASWLVRPITPLFILDCCLKIYFVGHISFLSNSHHIIYLCLPFYFQRIYPYMWSAPLVGTWDLKKIQKIQSGVICYAVSNVFTDTLDRLYAPFYYLLSINSLCSIPFFFLPAFALRFPLPCPRIQVSVLPFTIINLKRLNALSQFPNL